MKRDIAEKWIADLRAGPLQAKRVLFDGAGHCCLGRLCVLAGLEPKYNASRDKYEFGDRESFSLPPEVREWAGMKDEDGNYHLDDEDDELSQFLARDNDSGKTFAEIADIIEAHVDEL